MHLNTEQFLSEVIGAAAPCVYTRSSVNSGKLMWKSAAKVDVIALIGGASPMALNLRSSTYEFNAMISLSRIKAVTKTKTETVLRYTVHTAGDEPDFSLEFTQ